LYKAIIFSLRKVAFVWRQKHSFKSGLNKHVIFWKKIIWYLKRSLFCVANRAVLKGNASGILTVLAQIWIGGIEKEKKSGNWWLLF
jgi:hypothetical protein